MGQSIVQHNGSGEIVSYIDLNTDAAPYRFVQNNITQPVKERSAPPQPKSALKILKVGMAPSIGGAAQSRFVQQNTQQVPGTSALPPPKSTVRLLKGKGGAAQYTFVQQNIKPVQGTSAPPPPERVTSFKGGAAQTLSIYLFNKIPSLYKELVPGPQSKELPHLKVVIIWLEVLMVVYSTG